MLRRPGFKVPCQPGTHQTGTPQLSADDRECGLTNNKDGTETFPVDCKGQHQCFVIKIKRILEKSKSEVDPEGTQTRPALQRRRLTLSSKTWEYFIHTFLDILGVLSVQAMTAQASTCYLSSVYPTSLCDKQL